ncbi:hypothetical protein F5J12DRAFT_911827 [Pisolithus orientalis]|uniref:uncharacterized protein n=1 Tax=Pisolithus orientalis TaxID=936130 RepID=UPI0022244E72|nr:uncharacterized protein F5J12DRAFT_911827 [Pisolithus orientalis]KAI6012392.1 hypothetical protein F5J12DRAFT_911827 [Pisolithus orientalis]
MSSLPVPIAGSTLTYLMLDVLIEKHGECTHPYSFLPDLLQPLALRNLKLVNFVPTPELATATPTTLDLTFYGHPNWTAIAHIPLLIPAQLLTIRLLTSYTTSQMLLPDPVELPLLETLILALDN